MEPIESSLIEQLRVLVYAHTALGGTANSPAYKPELQGVLKLIEFVSRRAER